MTSELAGGATGRCGLQPANSPAVAVEVPNNMASRKNSRRVIRPRRISLRKSKIAGCNFSGYFIIFPRSSQILPKTTFNLQT
jgi:hypothetical protein